MTRDILQTDINLAARLMADHRPEDEIIRALVHRGVEPGPAAQLVDDLRSGRKVTPQSTAHLEFNPGRRSRSKGASHGTGENPTAPSPQAESRREPRTRPSAQRRRKPAVSWLIAAVLVGFGIVVGSIVLVQRYHVKTNRQEEQPPKLVMPKAASTPLKAPAPAAPARQITSPLPLILELQPDGLHLGGNLVARGDILTAVAHLLGLPTRTNQIGRLGTVLYAYDQRGLLIYSQKGGVTNSIILDYEGSGGTNGTVLPFTGSLKIEDHVVGPGTDSQALTAIKSLSLKHLGGDTGIWGGQYNGLDLVFAYLTSPQRLSRIEIDLK